jgi:hypothetical protein
MISRALILPHPIVGNDKSERLRKSN